MLLERGKVARRRPHSTPSMVCKGDARGLYDCNQFSSSLAFIFCSPFCRYTITILEFIRTVSKKLFLSFGESYVFLHVFDSFGLLVCHWLPGSGRRRARLFPYLISTWGVWEWGLPVRIYYYSHWESSCTNAPNCVEIPLSHSRTSVYPHGNLVCILFTLV